MALLSADEKLWQSSTSMKNHTLNFHVFST